MLPTPARPAPSLSVQIGSATLTLAVEAFLVAANPGYFLLGPQPYKHAAYSRWFGRFHFPALDPAVQCAVPNSRELCGLYGRDSHNLRLRPIPLDEVTVNREDGAKDGTGYEPSRFFIQSSMYQLSMFTS